MLAGIPGVIRFERVEQRSLGVAGGTGAAARIAARKPSTSSGLKTVVLAPVMTTTALLRLVTYQVHLPSFAVRNWP